MCFFVDEKGDGEIGECVHSVREILIHQLVCRDWWRRESSIMAYVLSVVVG